jgi:hypothetical protein
LHQKIRCGAKIAARSEVDRGLVTAVADKVAGGYKQWATIGAGIGHAKLLQNSWNARAGFDRDYL